MSLCYISDQTKLVDGITVKRMLDSSVRVTWIPVEMTSDETGGSPLYIVTYTPSDRGHTGSINTTLNSVTLAGLNSGVSYVIAVQVTFGKVTNNKDITPGMYQDDGIFIIGRLSAYFCEGE